MSLRVAANHWRPYVSQGRLLPLWTRRSSTKSSTSEPPVIQIPRANVYRFGSAASATPVFQDLEWTVKEGESWAVVGSASGEKTALFQVLLGYLRILPYPPPPGGLFPFLSSPPRDPHSHVSFVSFGNRQPASGGAFYDYTARYGAVHEEDRITLRQSMFPETIVDDLPREILEIAQMNKPKKELTRLTAQEQDVFDELVEKMGLKPFLDLPLIALSNGQTRRARILKAVLKKPELLLLDEPLTGLDVLRRPSLLNVLRSLHEKRSPRVIMGLRTQDPIPEWITHVALVQNGRVVTGEKDGVLAQRITSGSSTNKSMSKVTSTSQKTRSVLVDFTNVKVQYSDRVVLKNINWQIREGERWHLRGENGSGKTTLLSVLTGDHPQSYTQLARTSSHLRLFGRPRSKVSTPELHSLIGVVSPELFDAFPRRPGTTVWEAIGTGFDGAFVPQGKHSVGVGVMKDLSEEDVKWRVQRMWDVLEGLGPKAWQQAREHADGAKPSKPSSQPSDLTGTFKDRKFVTLSAGEQRMVLLMRALVGRPQVVLLDEVWSAMDESMVSAARAYLREGGVGEDQAVVVITHWEDEVPWSVEEGVKRFQLTKGEGEVVT